VVLRLDLDIPLSKFVEPPKIQEAASITGKSVPGMGSEKNSTTNKDAKRSENGSTATISPLGEEEHFWKHRQILDHSWVKKTVFELRLCMERMVNRVFVIGNLGERCGRPMGENSMKIVQHALQQHIDDVPIYFLSDANMPDFLERKAMDEFADNCIYVVENLNFHPEEFSCFEAKRESTKHEDNEESKEYEGSKPISREIGSRNPSKPGLTGS